MRRGSCLLLLAAALCCSAAGWALADSSSGGGSGARSSAECEKLGFPGPACSDCESMAEYVKDEELLGECKSCCTKDSAAVKFKQAVLEVCEFKLKGLPQIDDFIKKKAKSFDTSFRVQFRFGSYPRLVLSGASDGGSASSSSSIRIDNWKAAQIEEYLQEHLAGLPAASKK